MPHHGLISNGVASSAGRVIHWSGRLAPIPRYLLALLLIALAAALRIALHGVLGTQAPFITFYPAVLLTGALAGTGPALAALVVCGIAGMGFMEPAASLRLANPRDFVGLGVFVLMSFLVIYVTHQLRHALSRSELAVDQLARNQDLMRLLMDSTKDYAILLLDSRGRIVLWGAGAERVFGYSEEEILGKDGNILFTPEDARRRAFEMELQRATMQGRSEDERWHQRKDGTRIYVTGVVRPVRNSAEELVGFAKIARDMTERRRSEEELRTYRERLEELVAERTEALKQSLEQLRRAERLASIGTLAAGIAHEINNPLNSILLTADYARRFPQEVRDASTYETIMAEAKRCGRIVRGILTFARDERTPKEPGDVHEVIHRVAGMISQYVPSEQLWLDLDLAPALPPVAMNSTELEQVLVNLVKNAVEASEGEDVRVVVRTTRERGDVVLTVEDSGPGIEPATLRQIFDPFFSTHQHRGGTGLGLSICHGIITDHGGTITAQSSPGEGTCFTIRLPAMEARKAG